MTKRKTTKKATKRVAKKRKPNPTVAAIRELTRVIHVRLEDHAVLLTEMSRTLREVRDYWKLDSRQHAADANYLESVRTLRKVAKQMQSKRRQVDAGQISAELTFLKSMEVHARAIREELQKIGKERRG